MAQETGAGAVARTLAGAGVRRVFSLSGNQVLSLYEALDRAGIGIVHTRHEGAAVHMADGWARLTGEVGVALVSAGPGHANALGALAMAGAGESPLLLLSGHAPLARAGQGAFQEMDQVGLARPLTRWAQVARHPGEVAGLVGTALGGAGRVCPWDAGPGAPQPAGGRPGGCGGHRRRRSPQAGRDSLQGDAGAGSGPLARRTRRPSAGFGPAAAGNSPPRAGRAVRRPPGGAGPPGGAQRPHRPPLLARRSPPGAGRSGPGAGRRGRRRGRRGALAGPQSGLPHRLHRPAGAGARLPPAADRPGRGGHRAPPAGRGGLRGPPAAGPGRPPGRGRSAGLAPGHTVCSRALGAARGGAAGGAAGGGPACSR